MNKSLMPADTGSRVPAAMFAMLALCAALAVVDCYLTFANAYGKTPTVVVEARVR